jgi:stress-induced morphogen
VGTIAAMDAETIRDRLEQAFPEAEVGVEDRTGGGDHFQVTVASAAFAGLPLIDQHRRVNDVLAPYLADGSIHELRIKTRVPTKGTA